MEVTPLYQRLQKHLTPDELAIVASHYWVWPKLERPEGASQLHDIRRETNVANILAALNEY